MLTFARLWRLLLVAVAMPIAIQILDHWALEFAKRQQWSATSAMLLYGLYAAQTAALAWMSGKLLDHWGWRLLLFVWVLLTVNLNLVLVQIADNGALNVWRDSPVKLLVFSFFAAQYGALALWGALGSWQWPVRVPAALLGGLVLGLAIPDNSPGRPPVWSTLLWIQTGSLVALLVALLLARYRLRSPSELQFLNSQSRASQFSIAHLLIWTTAAGVLLAVFRTAQPLLVNRGSEWYRTAVLGIALSVVALAAIWATLGEGWFVLRIPVLVVLPPAMGMGIFLCVEYWHEMELQTPASRIDPSLAHLHEVGWLWLVWSSLVAAFLAALLLLLRSTGYRIVRLAPGGK